MGAESPARRPLLGLAALAGLAVAIAAMPPVAWADPSASASSALQVLLAPPQDGGKDVVGDDGRAYFAALPEHARARLEAAVAEEIITSPAQLAAIHALELTTQRLELLLADNCVLCHSNPAFHGPETLFSIDPAAAGSPPHMSLVDYVSDVHFRHHLSCAGCHGGDPTGYMAHDFPPEWPTDAEARHTDRKWIPGFCARCHSDAAYMRRFDPSLPTDQLAKYRTSHHGKLLLEQDDSRAAQCVSCHGVHGIGRSSSPLSKTYAKRIPETCGGCHANAELMKGFTLPDGSPLPTDQLEQYKTSVHGRALLEGGDVGAPACNDCHGNHSAIPPDVASVAQICRTCHAGNGTLFDGSRHKEVFEQHGWPECESCHGSHAIARPSDAMLGDGPQSVCVECHRQYSGGNPVCMATAIYFHDSIVGLVAHEAQFSSQEQRLAEKGLDTDGIQERLVELGDAIKLSRSYIHSFERSDFDEVLARGTKASADLERLIAESKTEYRQRGTGVLVAVLIMALLAFLIWLKLRSVERTATGEPASREK